jgi:hypothetical protein
MVVSRSGDWRSLGKPALEKTTGADASGPDGTKCSRMLGSVPIHWWKPDHEVLLAHFADLALELGRLPVYSELRLKKRTDPSFPNDKTFMRLGSKAQLLAKLRQHCSAVPKYASLLPLIDASFETAGSEQSAGQQTESVEGFVYLVKMGKHYKIGRTFSMPRRHRELALELPEKLKPIHVIRTDDPSGIEAYWHKRFQAKCTNGEWFALSPADVSIFKKRRYM